MSGDLLLCKINPRINRVWVVRDTSGGRPQIASTEYLVLRVTHPDVITPYLMWYLRSPGFRAWIELAVEGATGSHTRAKSGPTLEQPVPIPPLGYQRRLVAAIEEQFSRLDEAERLLRSLKQRISGLRGLLFQDALAPDWRRAPLERVATVVSGQTPKGLVTVQGSLSGAIPYYKVGDMNLARDRVMANAREYVSEGAVSRFRLHIRPPGTVIFPKRGGAIATNKKRLLSQPAVFDLNTMGLIPGNELLPEFLLNWLETVDLSGLSDGSNVPQINHSDMANLTIPLPPIDVQAMVVATLDRHLSVLNSVSATVEHALIRSARLRRAILQRAFTGQLVPQDPCDDLVRKTAERPNLLGESQS